MSDAKALSLDSRTYYYDFLRIFSIFCVVVIHTAATKLLETTIGGGAWYFISAWDSLTRWAVPMFVMISGALLLNPAKKFTIKDFYKKNVLRLVIAYFVWSLFYALVYGWPYGFEYVRDATIKGHYHMWFILMLIGLYIITPFLRKLVEDKALLKYYVLIALIFTFVLPAVVPLLEDKAISSFYSGLAFKFTIGYASYFVLGYYLATTDFSKTVRYISYLLGIIGLAATAGLTIFSSLEANNNIMSYWDNFSIFMLMTVVGIFLFAKYELSRIKLSGKIAKAVADISKYCFGVYLVHAYILTLVSSLGITVISFHALVSVPAIAFLVFIISLFISFVLNKIPVISKYIV